MLIRSVFFLIVILFLSCKDSKEDFLQINGTVINSDTKSILLVKTNQDLRFDSIIVIPVINGKFQYTSKLEYPEAVRLMLGEAKENGGGRVMPLFLENEYMDLVIYPESDFDKNTVKGGLSNKLYESYKNKVDSLFKDKAFEELLIYEQDYISRNPNLVSYYFLLEHLKYFDDIIDLNLAKSNYKSLAEAYPNHPYNALAESLIYALENIQIGKYYVDFSAPDVNGALVKLSDKIEGKVALLNLWATWCGPCIAKSRTMVPIYEAYKDKGFTIIGVAGEFKNTDKLVRFLDKEKWSWLNLVELDRQNNIWQKYGVDGGGGALFLIDEKGKIIAIDPTADEVKSVLDSKQNKII
jgi:peroxiredoxin